jgi:glycosyltransferase involved in cell wall biosynthesis
MFALQVASTKGRGGIVTALRHYARMFSLCGVESLTLYRGPAFEALSEAGVETLAAPPALISALGFLDPMAALRRSVCERHGDPDLVIAHSDMALRGARRLWPGAVFVAPCHSDKVKRKRAADIVITLNPVQHAHIEAALLGASARVALLGNPFVFEDIGAASAAETPTRLVFCGRFIDTKDPALLLRASQLMQARAALLFIGAGPLEADLKRMTNELGLDATFTGWVAQPFAHMTANDILVLPSSWEGLPYMLQEALAHGVGVAAADNPGNRYALGDGAFGELFATGDAGALAALLDCALAEPVKLRHKAAQGRDALAARFGPRAFYRALHDIAAPLIAQRHAEIAQAGARLAEAPL